ncbi:putative Ribosomal protein L34e superfamily protein [Hibiscus syriacus]|uniref:RING-type E3 ubiquitin transferase n=1 Tax=Hibiscus syriacus TaxID=106335 RepID=A0A6A3D9B4_HIBSY|nr:putative Ribosomal protein L34e superfamily protein [Hibiscus syriacus]
MADAPTGNRQHPRLVFFVFNLRAGDGSKLGPAPASRASIEAMPRIKVKESPGECSICLDEFQADEEDREMPCKHVFHSGCIEKWLQIHGSCPVCRYFMPSAETAESGGGAGGPEGLEGGENINGLEVFQSVLALAGLAIFMGVMGSGRVDDDVSFTRNNGGN